MQAVAPVDFFPRATFGSDIPIQRRVGRRSGTLYYFDHARSIRSVAERRNMVCPSASRPMRVTAP